MRRLFGTLLSLSLGILLFGLFLYRTDMGAILRHLESVHLGWLLLGLSINLVAVLLRSYRWILMLSPIHRCSFTRATGATFLGYALSTLLPARVGEVIRPLYLAGEEGFSRVSSVASVVLERLMDTTFLLGLACIALMSLGGERATALTNSLRQGAIVGLVILGVAYGFALVLVYRPSLGEWLIGKIKWARIRAPLSNIFRSLTFLKPGWSLLLILLLGGLIWLGIALNAYCAFRAFDIELGLPESFMVIALMGAGFLVPSPGGVGGVHKAMQIGLTEIYGIGYDLASAYALVLHAVAMIPLTLIGLAYMVVAKTSWKKLLALRNTKEGMGETMESEGQSLPPESQLSD
ncbi:MAG TPA: lysylphosphatidylglycerol synthase transmembrane domain-containing protein [Thermoanaerobaculia bacterium]|nr:lysylphosphatidylglycerol synthase transmembrane domain-containing protein [Thermoanaerobaculia bacterium]HUM28684.1 lysylphosphatidylglycerol synthase transmembrane domain-containing protein [Thermoanaerobaculia bacterium]HXK66708.1 lysylphosphatidylglycerol synthase transmembrane domain-containing protein [Thermoanaerobaculia bacterium]